MIVWLTENFATILISITLVAVITLIIMSMVKGKKHGKSSCGCNCAHCPMSGNCQPKK